MNYSIMLDVGLVVIGSLVILKCYYTGFVGSVVKLIGTVVSYAVAYIASGPVADGIYKLLLKSTIEQHIANNLPEGIYENSGNLNQLALEFDKAKDELIVMLEQALAVVKIEAEFPEKMLESSFDALSQITTVGEDISVTIAAAMVEPIATTALRVGSFFALFVIMAGVLACVLKVGQFINKIPLVGGINHILGGVVGVVEAGILLYILTLVGALVVTATSNDLNWLNWQVIEDTKLFIWLTEQNLPLNLNFFDIGIV